MVIPTVAGDIIDRLSSRCACVLLDEIIERDIGNMMFDVGYHYGDKRNADNEEKKCRSKGTLERRQRT